MRPVELTAARRSTINDAVFRRLVPSATIYRQVPTGELAEMVDELNQPGALPPGLEASLAHLVFRAAALAINRHPHFGNLLLPGGATFEVPQTVMGLPLRGPGAAGGTLLGDPAQGSLAEVVAGLNAAEVEGQIKAQNDFEKDARDRRNHPLFSFVVHGLIREGIIRVRDRVKLPPGMIKVAVEQASNMIVFNLGPQGGARIATTLTGPRHAAIFVCAPQPSDSDPKQELLPIGLAYDLRLFEAYEAAQLLSDIARQLASPRDSLA